MAREKSEILDFIKEGSSLIIAKDELELFIPHRRKALKIDGVIFTPTTKNYITGFKKIELNDPDLDGHYDSKPVYPGVSIAECANLTAAMLIMLTNENAAGYPTVVDFHCKCKRPVFPGDEIVIKLNFLGKEHLDKQNFYSFNYTVEKFYKGNLKMVGEGSIIGTST